MPISPLKIQLFGPFLAQRDGVPLPGLHLREGERLLAYLTLLAGEPVTSRELAQRFWPFEAQGTLVGQGDFPNVRQALRFLRQALGPDAFRLKRPERSSILLDLEGVDADVLHFDHLMHQEGEDRERAWEEAVTLYRGPLLTDWTDAWVVEPRERRQREYERSLRRLAQTALLRGEGQGAERWMRQMLASRPDDEETARDLLRLLKAKGRHLDIKETQERLETAVKAAGRSLDPETVVLLTALRQEWERTPLSLQNTAPSSAATPLPPAGIPAPQTIRPISPPLPEPPASEFAVLPLESVGGAMPLDSGFYIEREADRRFHAAVMQQDSIVLVKGARQVGKTSLLARGLQQARQTGIRVVFTDFQKLNEAQLQSPDALYLALATRMALQLKLQVSPRETWNPDFGANLNLELFLRCLLDASPEPLVWGLDEVDRLFACPFGSEVFGLFRSLHNERSLDPSCPWSRLTLAIAYATEAYLFIADLNQSPFNVGTRLALEDFTREQVTDLNRRYGCPLPEGEIDRLYSLIGGHPYLVRRSLDEMVRGLTWERLEQEGDREEGPFGDHLRRLSVSLSRAPELIAVLRGLLAGNPCRTSEAFYRLRTAGVLAGASAPEAVFRCPLYVRYLRKFLG
ncbi:MAG: hypothetical protein JWN14_3578 [Chthonomonadales bacterium]|nr:hypothetical protein [Chthonomonadales bacterium]